MGAYSSVKESPYCKTEVGEVVACVYTELQKLLFWTKPAEIKILKHLMKIEDPLKLSTELERAIVPGTYVESRTHDYLSANPELLLKTVEMSLEVLGKLQEEKTNRIKEIDCAHISEHLRI